MENFVYILITGLLVFLVMYSQLKKKDTDLKVLQAQEENKIDLSDENYPFNKTLEDLNNHTLKLLEGIKNFGLDNINTAIDILDRSKAELDELKRLLNSEISKLSGSYSLVNEFPVRPPR